MTEIELLEMRYSGKAAKIFRGFNAIYGGVFKAAVTLGWVTLAIGCHFWNHSSVSIALRAP